MTQLQEERTAHAMFAGAPPPAPTAEAFHGANAAEIQRAVFELAAVLDDATRRAQDSLRIVAASGQTVRNATTALREIGKITPGPS